MIFFKTDTVDTFLLNQSLRADLIFLNIWVEIYQIWIKMVVIDRF